MLTQIFVNHMVDKDLGVGFSYILDLSLLQLAV